MPNSPELDWAGKRCGHNHLPAECPHERCGYREALVEVERLRAGREKRPETGPMQFPDDWPGLFIRGDNACGLFINLKQLLDRIERDGVDVGLQKAYLRNMIRLLESCDAAHDPKCQQAVMQSQAPDDQRERGGGE